MARTYEKKTLAALYAVEAKKGMDFRLSRLDPVLDVLGHPERAAICVHIAGTNGKGSTAAMIESALRTAGHSTGLYTSPHLVSFRERIRTDGIPISTASVVEQVDVVETAARQAGASLTFFEITTLAAFIEFRERRVDAMIVEAGLGGRLDATNVASGDVAVITSVGIDHAEYLGGTVAEIAAEKAAIIKPRSICVTGPLGVVADEIVERRVNEVGARRLAYSRDFGDYEPLARVQREVRRNGGRGLAGLHQLRNAAVAAAAVDALTPRLHVTPEQRDAGILAARWPGRLEVLRRPTGDGPLVLDAAHNADGAEALAAALDEVAPARPRVLVFAAMADKDWRAMLTTLAPKFDRVVFAPLPMPRAEQPNRFLEIVPGATVAASPDEALAIADAAASVHGSVVVAGSIFLLGNLYRSAGGALLEDDLED